MDSLDFFLPVTPEARLKRGLFAFLWITFIYFGSTPSWNPNTRFDLVRAIVEEQTFAIDSYHQNTGDICTQNSGRYDVEMPPSLPFCRPSPLLQEK